MCEACYVVCEACYEVCEACYEVFETCYEVCVMRCVRRGLSYEVRVVLRCVSRGVLYSPCCWVVGLDYQCIEPPLRG